MNQAIPDPCGTTIATRRYSALSSLPELLALHQKGRYDARLGGFTYPVTPKDAEIAANYLDNAAERMAAAVESLGYLLDRLPSDEEHQRELDGIPSLFILLGALINQARMAEVDLRHFAEQAQAGQDVAAS